MERCVHLDDHPLCGRVDRDLCGQAGVARVGADGAALTGADAGASGDEAYAGGLDSDLHLDADIARAAVLSYLRRAGAYARYPGLTAQVSVDATTQRVIVEVHAPVHLPLHVPGSPDQASIGATSAATVGVDG